VHFLIETSIVIAIVYAIDDICLVLQLSKGSSSHSLHTKTALRRKRDTVGVPLQTNVK